MIMNYLYIVHKLSHFDKKIQHNQNSLTELEQCEVIIIFKINLASKTALFSVPIGNKQNPTNGLNGMEHVS